MFVDLQLRSAGHHSHLRHCLTGRREETVRRRRRVGGARWQRTIVLQGQDDGGAGGHCFQFHFLLLRFLNPSRRGCGELVVRGAALERLHVAQRCRRGNSHNSSHGSACGHAFAHMLLQRAGDGEGRVAEPATVNVLAGAAVRLHVTRQFTALCTRVVAEIALVRLFP
jgi:hypothetical protein